ncbi:hypothetical protein B1F70_23395, partial [Pseudomonas syringae]
MGAFGVLACGMSLLALMPAFALAADSPLTQAIPSRTEPLSRAALSTPSVALALPCSSLRPSARTGYPSSDS